jgi:hypothetical protein
LHLFKDSTISENYRSSIRVAVIFSGIAAILSGLMLDGGETARLTGIGLAVFWVSVLVAIRRRPRTPTHLDLLYIRWGCPSLLIVFQAAIHYAWHLRGLQ